MLPGIHPGSTYPSWPTIPREPLIASSEIEYDDGDERVIEIPAPTGGSQNAMRMLDGESR